MKVVWSQAAVRALSGVLAYLNALNPVAARRIGHRLREGAGSLAVLPQRYRDRGQGLRCMPVFGTPYPIIYRIEEDRGIIRILAVRHGRQDEAE